VRARDDVGTLGEVGMPFMEFNALSGTGEQMTLADRYRDA
jgi:hypothetical protein